jgi:NAD(P)-dependent dehydrogenase (short-subunit alcohol dehydrogenase family)
MRFDLSSRLQSSAPTCWEYLGKRPCCRLFRLAVP